MDRLAQAMFRKAYWATDETTNGLLFAMAVYRRTEDPLVFTCLRDALETKRMEEYFDT